MSLVFEGLAAISWAAPVLVTLLAAQRFAALTHSWSTTYVVMASPLFEKERQKHPGKYLLVPSLIFTLSMALGLTVAFNQRFPTDGKLNWGLWAFMLYIGVFYVGHFWHFGRQDFGVLSLYRFRAGQTQPLERQLDEWYAGVLMYVVQPIVYFRTLTSTPFSEIFYFLAPLKSEVIEGLARVGLVVTIGFCLFLLAREVRSSQRSIPRAMYYVVMALHPVLLYFGPLGLGLCYAAAYLWSHWFIATALVTRIHTSAQIAQGLSRRFAYLRHLLIVGGVTLSVWLITRPNTRFHILSLEDFEYKQVLNSLEPTELWLAGIFLGFFLGEQLVHYYCDRCLFRFKDPGVRAAVGPYL